MRLISSYRTLYTVIIMGSYSRNFLIASVVSLIGIGICLALEHRWRNLGQAPSDRRLVRSDRVLVKNTSSEEAEDNPQPSGESLSFDDDSREHQGVLSEDVLKVDDTVENEDEVTVLFGPMSNFSIHVKSSPGLPTMDIDHKTSINKKDYNQQSQMEDKIEDIESCSKLLSDVEIEDTASWIEQILENVKLDISRDNSSEANQPKKESKEAVGDLMVSSTLITDNVHLIKDYQGSIVDEKQKCLLQNDKGNPYLLNDCQGTIVDEKQECPLQNDSLHLIKDCQELKVDDKLENNPVEYSCIAHKLEECTPEATEDKSVAPPFNPYPTETFVLNVETQDFIPEIFMEKTVLIAEHTSPFAFQRSPSEETRSARSIKESLEETYASISSVPQSRKLEKKDSTVPPVNTENVKCEKKSLQNRPLRNGLRYSDMAAIPKKAKLHYEDSSGEEKEKKDDIPKTPKHIDKNRVRRLVGFFENKCEKH